MQKQKDGRIMRTCHPVEDWQTIDIDRVVGHMMLHRYGFRFGKDLSTSMTACANACGASWGRLWPTPPETVRCSYSPENRRAYAVGSACGAPLASPSSVIVGTEIVGATARRCSIASYWASPSGRRSRQR